jgi:hypothetical protein
MAGKGGADMPGFGGFGMYGSNGGAPGLGGGSRGGENALNHFRRSRDDDDHLSQGNGRRRPSTAGSGRDASNSEGCDSAGSFVPLADGEAGDAAADANAANEHGDIGLKHVQSMERAHVVMALDAKKRKLERATSKAALKKVKPPPSTPAWDIGDDDEDAHEPELPSVDAVEPTPTPKPGRKQVNPTGVSPPAPKGKKTAGDPSCSWPRAVGCRPAAGVPPKAKAVAATTPKAKAVATTPQKIKAGKVVAVAHPRAKAVAATPQKHKAVTAVAAVPLTGVTVASPGKPSLHGISFLDLVHPQAARDAKTRGAFTSRAYDTTKKRAASKFGADDVRVIETSRAAYKLASGVYTQACG